jgi:hypothetical protein
MFPSSFPALELKLHGDQKPAAAAKAVPMMTALPFPVGLRRGLRVWLVLVLLSVRRFALKPPKKQAACPKRKETGMRTTTKHRSD